MILCRVSSTVVLVICLNLILPNVALVIPNHGNLGEEDISEEQGEEQWLSSNFSALRAEIAIMEGVNVQRNSLKSKDCQADKSKHRAAMMISGLETRLLLISKFNNVVKPLAEAGVPVDVFIDVVSSSKGFGSEWSPIRKQVASNDLAKMQEVISTYLQNHCGSLNLLSIREDREKIDFPPNKTVPFHYPKDIGMNVLRLHSSHKLLMDKIAEEEEQRNFKYDFVISSRDDDDWVAEFQPSLLYTRDKENTMFVKDCVSYGGYADQTLFFGREAADKILGKYFSYIMDHLSELPPTAEAALKEFADDLAGVNVDVVSFFYMPTSVATYVKKPSGELSICHKKKYTCDLDKDANDVRWKNFRDEWGLHPCLGREVQHPWR